MKKADNVQRKKCENVKTFRKPGESLLKTTLKMTRQSKEMRVGSRLSHNSV